ncbi:AAA ATPase [Pyrolobus fumarii 1A]|uniref:AAA ATPase n=1 Tax=Pyrolobus fumarii (strain DSM 11204 / 1A) TaxID=694429 RepID=G0EFT5_PYRF1|nr:MoxR family ATPase [Pyrolobus fumarii]AEM38256.1 AAA ATPase [Pyrolobus fumarii 1A]
MKLSGGYGPVLDHAELERLLYALARSVIIDGRGGREAPAVFIWGPPGVGKSDTVRRVAARLAEESGRRLVEYEGVETHRMVSKEPEKYLVLVDIRASQLEPSDVQGLPRLVEEDGAVYTVWAAPLWARILSLPGIAGILFLDEVNLASPLVQAALYQVILERRVGSLHLSNRVFVVAAGNREQIDNPYARPLAPPLANRFVHVTLECPDPTSWLRWAEANGVHPWIREYIASSAAGGKNPLCGMRAVGESHAFPTPRSWEFASSLLKRCQEAGGCKRIEDDDTVMMIAAAVGNHAANEWKIWAEVMRGLPSPKTLAKNPEKLAEVLSSVRARGESMAAYYILARVAYAALDDPEVYANFLLSLENVIRKARLTTDYFNAIVSLTHPLARDKLEKLRSKNPKLYQQLNALLTRYYTMQPVM